MIAASLKRRDAEDRDTFFIDGKYSDLDKIQCEINDIMEFMDNICLVLSKNIEETGKAKKRKEKNM